MIHGIPPELLKHSGVAMKKKLTKLFNVIAKEQIAPAEWKKVIIVPIFKNRGSKLDCKKTIEG